MKNWAPILGMLLLTACQPSAQQTGHQTKTSDTPDLPPPFCQDDVKQCPHGQTVRRDPMNNCEFANCPSLKACTKELKRCDNGRSVGRDPLNDCEFHPCDVPAGHSGQPNKEPMMCTQEVKQCPDGSYVGRDSYNNCAFKPCPKGTSNTH